MKIRGGRLTIWIDPTIDRCIARRHASRCQCGDDGRCCQCGEGSVSSQSSSTVIHAHKLIVISRSRRQWSNRSSGGPDTAARSRGRQTGTVGRRDNRNPASTRRAALCPCNAAIGRASNPTTINRCSQKSAVCGRCNIKPAGRRRAALCPSCPTVA